MPQDTLLIPGTGGLYAKSLSDPFWAAVARMQPGARVRGLGADGQLETYVVQDGPRYGRPEVNDVSVVVRRIGGRAKLTLAAWSLVPCVEEEAASARH